MNQQDKNKNMSAIIKPKMNDLINIKVIQKDFDGEKKFGLFCSHCQIWQWTKIQ